MNNPSAKLTSVSASELERYLEPLSEILYQCVHDGASIGFVLPFSRQSSRDHWLNTVLPELKAGKLTLFVAKLDGLIAGTVQLAFAAQANQAHRAEVAKLLVSPAFQRRGVAKLLMQGLEQQALTLGYTLLTLDTRTGDKAEPLYLALGYDIAGIIPDFAQDPLTNQLDPTTLMFKKLKQ